MSTVTGRISSPPDFQWLQDVTPKKAREITKATLGDADFSELEKRILAMMTEEERQHALSSTIPPSWRY